MNKNLPKKVLVSLLFALSAIPMLILWLFKPPKDMPNLEEEIPIASMKKRTEVMEWWADLSYLQKTLILRKYTKELNTTKHFQELTGSEIEFLYNKMNG